MLPQSPLSPSVGLRARSLLAVLAALALALLAAAPAHASVSSFLGSFDNGGFSAFNDGVNTTNATLSVVSDRAYDGTESAFASYPGGGVNAYARVLEDVSWSAGDDVWYGAAYYLPTGFKSAMQQEVALQRWDNWSTYGSDADEGGIVIWNSDKLARLKVGRYDASTETLLTNGFSLPEGQWFWLEVHQRFSATSGQALNEVYLNGTLVGSSTTANYDRPIEKLRTGLVAQGGIAQTNPLSLWFDRVSIGSQQLGPLGGTTSTSPTPTPAPAPAPTPVAPTVTITSPAAGTTFGDWLGMSASVTADTTIARVDFIVDGTVVASRTSSPWSYTYDATGLSSGWHTVTIRATDANGLVGEASVQVNHYVKHHGSTRLAKAAATRIHMSVTVHHRHRGKKHHRKHRRHHAHAARRTHRHAHHRHTRHHHRTA